MATKENLLLSNFKVSSSNQNCQLKYSNLNLNNVRGDSQRDGFIFNVNQSNGFMISSNFSTGNDYGSKQHGAMRSGNHQVRQLIQKWETRISSNDLGNKKSKKVINEKSDSSTLSLHIAAYENVIEDQKRDDDYGGRKKSKYSSFEIPRQQKEDEKEPEIMQFKSSQKLLSSTEQQPTSNGQQQSSDEKKVQVAAEVKKLNELPGPLQTEKSRYEFLNKIGRGSTGIVYCVKNQKGELFALKECQKVSEIYPDLQICKLAEICQSSHFAKVEEAGSYGKKYYGIFELLGPTLDEIAETATKSKILCLAKQSLQCIEQLHDMGFYHGDISGTNLAVGQIGTAKEQIVYLFDFDQSESIHKKPEEDKFKDWNYQRDDLAKWLEIFLGYLGVPMDVECGIRDSEEFKKENLDRIKHLDGFPFIYLHIRTVKPEKGKYNYEYIYKTLDYALEVLGEPLKWDANTYYVEPVSTFDITKLPTAQYQYQKEDSSDLKIFNN